jgi:hypothetical protein
VNNELHIGGNSYGPNAVGRDARAVQRNVAIGETGDDQLAAALGRLRTLLAANRDQIPHAERVEKDVDALDQEAHDADPDPERLRDTLRRIIARVGQVGVVLAAANDLHDIVETMIH